MLFKFLDYLISRSHQFDKRVILGWCMRFGIPFNSTHPFKILEISNTRSQLKQKLTWFNKNHLRGMHACAIATIGELSAGLLLMKNFSPRKYRFILKTLNNEYLYQGRTHLFTSCELPSELIEQYKKDLNKHGIVDIDLQTIINDKQENHVASVTSTWQIKSWDKIKTT